MKAYIKEAKNKNGDMDKDNSKDGITFDAEVAMSPGNFIGTEASLLEKTMEAAKIYFPKVILKTPRPNNIGKGLWHKQLNAYAASTASKFGKFAKAANFIGDKSGIIFAVTDTLSGVSENIKEDAPIEEIIVDAAVDSAYSAVGGIATSAAAGSIAGSVVPVAGTLAGAVGGTIGGIAYMIITEGVKFDDKSLKDLTKDALYKHGRVKPVNPNTSLKLNSEEMKRLRKKLEDKKSKDRTKN